MRIPRVLAVAAAILALGCGRGQPPGGESRADTARPAESMPAGQQPRMELGAAAQLDSGLRELATRIKVDAGSIG